jgi:hypothetical protein
MNYNDALLDIHVVRTRGHYRWRVYSVQPMDCAKTTPSDFPRLFPRPRRYQPPERTTHILADTLSRKGLHTMNPQTTVIIAGLVMVFAIVVAIIVYKRARTTA